MRIEKQMTHQASHTPSKQWKHLKTDNEPLYSGNHPAGVAMPGGNAEGGCYSMYTPILQPFIADPPL
jgi:hypothetical protein